MVKFFVLFYSYAFFHVNLQLECESSSVSMPMTPQQDSRIRPYDVEFGGDIAEFNTANMSNNVLFGVYPI